LTYKLKPVKYMHYDPYWLKVGTDVELEHTTDRKLARIIASQHLAEHLDYYKELKKIESKLGI